MTSAERPQTDATLRGVVVVAAALVVGALVMANTSASRGVAASTASPTTAPRVTHVTAPPTTVPAVHPPASVSVLVLNGVDPKKAIAKPAATKLTSAGYAALAPRDSSPVTATVVYFAPGYQADAAAIAALLQLPPAALTALPSPVPSALGDVQTAQVVVLIGPDGVATSTG